MNDPQTITYDGKALLQKVKETAADSPLLNALKETAEEFLLCGRFSVVDRNQKAISGDIHDYVSMGPYWWPNPDTPDGLPYIRRDGEINPETVETVTYRAMTDMIHTLAVAALYLGDKRYSEKAVKILWDWHLSPETYMHPHMEYAQSIPGICKGRGIGLIDFSTSYRLFDGIAILDYLGALDSEMMEGLKKWYGEVVDWMLTSQQGKDEQKHHNNHGTWYDVQIASASLFIGRVELAKETLRTSYERRVLAHVKEDGAQPHELERTKGIHYSLYNLEGLMLLGNMAKKVGVLKPFWEIDGEKGDLLRLATDYITPYAMDPSTFPYSELSPEGSAQRIAPLLMRAAHYYPDGGYSEQALAAAGDKALWRLVPQA